jgi:hypothetical protein
MCNKRKSISVGLVTPSHFTKKAPVHTLTTTSAPILCSKYTCFQLLWSRNQDRLMEAVVLIYYKEFR